MSPRPFLLSLALAGLAALTAVAAFTPASAHERRQVGDVWMVVGWKTEPALLEQPNALDLRVYRLKEGADPAKQTAADRLPIEGLDKTLKAEVMPAGGGGPKMALPLRARFNDPGAYDGVVLPTQSGDFTFHLFGTVEGKDVDQSFTSGPNTFGSVQELTPIEFPVKLTSNLDLTRRVQQLEGQLNPEGNAPASARVSTGGDSDSSLPTVLAVLALAASIVAAGIAGLSLRRGK